MNDDIGLMSCCYCYYGTCRLNVNSNKVKVTQTVLQTLTMMMKGLRYTTTMCSALCLD